MVFRPRYVACALALLGLEALIACFAHDPLIRPYGGDLLATVFVYCLLRSFLPGRPAAALALSLLASYLVEISQYFGLITHLGWQHARWAQLLLGSSFEWLDLVAYTLGAALVWEVEQHQAPIARGPASTRQRRTNRVY